MVGLDWAAMLKAGFKAGGLRPNEIWALTPAELLLLVGPERGSTPLGRQGLDALIRHFPDLEGNRDE